MSRPTVLLIDNQPTFLETCAEFLELAGYSVEKAYTVDEAWRKLEEKHVHLAVVDMRLVNDADDKDWSGIALAKKSDPTIPKIILTGFQSWDAVRESLGVSDSGGTPAISFVAKQEGVDVLLDHIQRAFLKYVEINWDLDILWKARDQYSMASSFGHLLSSEQLVQRSLEIEDLFRRLFLDKKQIVIDRQLWQRTSNLLLIVNTYDKRNLPESVLVQCGAKRNVTKTVDAYQEFAPSAPGHNATVLKKFVSTEHYAACVYGLANADLEDVFSLTDLFKKSLEKSFNSALTDLFEKTLREWHEGRTVTTSDVPTEEIYRERLELTPDKSQANFEATVRFIIRQAPTVGVEFEQRVGKLDLRFGGEVFSYPDPRNLVYQEFRSDELALLAKTPGRLSGDNILADRRGDTWLTDFSEAGVAPVLWNYVAMESAVRFDWAEGTSIRDMHDMERALVGSEFSKLPVADIDPRLRKCMRAIGFVRKLALRIVNRHLFSYHLGVFYHACTRLTETDLTFESVKRIELLRLTHVLMAVAMIGDKLLQETPPSNVASAAPTIRFDISKHEVEVNGVTISLHGQSYELLRILYSNENQLCPREMLIEQLFRERFDESNHSQTTRLNTAIRRLREKIEEDPDKPRFIVTAPLGGYKLTTRSSRP